MMFDPNPKKQMVPFGLVTLVLVGAALAGQWWLQGGGACDELRLRLDRQGGGYFLRWQAPELLLLTKDKQQRREQAQDETTACSAMLNQLRG